MTQSEINKVREDLKATPYGNALKAKLQELDLMEGFYYKDKKATIIERAIGILQNKSVEVKDGKIVEVPPFPKTVYIKALSTLRANLKDMPNQREQLLAKKEELEKILKQFDA